MAIGKSASLHTMKSSLARHPVGRRPPKWWINRETRLLLRAMYGRAMTLWHQGRYGESASQLEALLALNPSDNQASASSFLYCSFSAKIQNPPLAISRPTRRNILTIIPSLFLFGWALGLTFAGDEFSAREKYREAILRNIYIAPMLLEEPEPPRGLWQPNDRAEPNYAAEFIDSYAVLWDREAGASRILRECWQELQPRIGQIVTLRERMADFQDQRYERSKRLWQQLLQEDEKLTAGEL